MKSFLIAMAAFFAMNTARAAMTNVEVSPSRAKQNCTDVKNTYSVTVSGWNTLPVPDVLLIVDGTAATFPICNKIAGTDEPAFLCNADVAEDQGFKIELYDNGDGSISAFLQVNDNALGGNPRIPLQCKITP